MHQIGTISHRFLLFRLVLTRPAGLVCLIVEIRSWVWVVLVLPSKAGGVSRLCATKGICWKFGKKFPTFYIIIFLLPRGVFHLYHGISTVCNTRWLWAFFPFSFTMKDATLEPRIAPAQPSRTLPMSHQSPSYAEPADLTFRPVQISRQTFPTESELKKTLSLFTGKEKITGRKN